ncbi:FecCD family ABC transporter permease [Blastococcus tunisiensis]|uniref:Iron complex transport system permease protein n=1 Tax=Blastococcus tunisiensis TaxID=1798228 RepID=A0A1I2AFG9_9ACTN|nr:iron ABC transporter permease [Blastococcus sp. DSM 46838]SFE42764.1 iron complex transport system permease protein [Blastococcus sp. DSM 46838]
MSLVQRLGVTGLAVVALVTVVVASVAVGSVSLPVSEVLGALSGTRELESHLIVTDLRIPRTVAGLVAGACLAVSGVLLQGATRNPLASPALLGITHGGGFAVVVAVALLGLPPSVAVWAAFLGGAAAAGVALALATSGRDGLSPIRLVLSGAIVSAVLLAWTNALLALNEHAADDVRHWLAGSLAGRDAAAVAPLLPLVVIALAGSWLLAGPLDALALGDEQAVGLGQHPTRVRLLAGLVAVLLAAVAVALAGPIAFVGLAVPHVARALLRSGRHRQVLLLSAALGPVLLLGADIIGRVAARPTEVQAGVLTALIGAPLLVRLAVRHKATS